MATNQNRLAQRNRQGPVRVKVDENAHARARQVTGIPVPGLRGLVQKEGTGQKVANIRTALSEVTRTTVNRTDNSTRVILGKAKVDATAKRVLPSAQPQRVSLPSKLQQPAQPAAPAPAPAPAPTRAPLSRIPSNTTQQQQLRISRVPSPAVPIEEDEDDYLRREMEALQEEVMAPHDEVMQLEEDDVVEEPPPSDLIDFNSEADIETWSALEKEKEPLISVWPNITPERAAMYNATVDHIRATYAEWDDECDPTMVSEYAEEIFQYMAELEEEILPDPDYLKIQTEISWDMRAQLVDWLASLHLTYHMVPETLWTAVNIMDRFLSLRCVSKVKLQLVGLAAMFIACKYEEILAPSLEEFAKHSAGAFTKEDILKGERIILQILEFKVSHYCSPYSWMRKISRADDYEIQTRTLAKFLCDATLLDHRFLPVKPQLVAAVGMYTARKMLGGDWNEGFVFASGYTEEYLIPGHNHLCELMLNPRIQNTQIFKKYAHKKFLKCASFALTYAQRLAGQHLVAEQYR